jgi:hypothetical protein
MTYTRGPDGTLIRMPAPDGSRPTEDDAATSNVPLDENGRPNFAQFMPRGPKPERPLSSRELSRPPSRIARQPRARPSQPEYDPALFPGEDPPEYAMYRSPPQAPPPAPPPLPIPIPQQAPPTAPSQNGLPSPPPPPPPVHPTPGREHLQKPPGTRLRCGDLVFLRMHTKRYAMECEIETEHNGHANQPHMARLQEVESGDEIFLGWRHGEE